jgi:hypothetical protein
MISFADLLNPTFLMFLGILLLSIAILVVYFESKAREQNHKIASMLSIVSTLAEDINGIKFGLNHLAVSRGGSFEPSSFEDKNISLVKSDERGPSLIPVSDDDSDSGSDDVSESETEDSVLESDAETVSDEEVDEIEMLEERDPNVSDIKVLKLNIGSESSKIEINDSNVINEYYNLDNSDDNSYTSEFNSDPNDLVEDIQSSIHLEEIEQEIQREESVNQLDIHTSELKTINIHLEDVNYENVDYKKMSLPKLKSIVMEKGLTDDSSKLKKNDLLKLLGVE